MNSPNKPPVNHFFVDAKRYETDKDSLTGAEIKAAAGVVATNQLFLEEHGDKPDKAIADGESISVTEKGGVKHLYAVPPATFGAR